jgi:ribonuclease G
LPLSFLRRRKSDESAPTEAAAPAAPLHESPVIPQAAAESGAAEKAKPRRRRGSRGGRGRKRPGEATAQATNGEAKVAEAKPKTEPRQRAARPRAEGRKDGESSNRQRRSQQSNRRRQPTHKPLPAAKRELLVSVDVSEQRVAVLEDDRVAEVYLERPERRSIAGNIYKGIVDNVLPGMEAAFVEIGLEKNGFLYVDEIVSPELEGKRHGKRIQDLLSRGQEILVQAVKDPMKTKGARLTTEISLPGRFVVLVPQGEGIGVSRRLDDDERSRLKEILRGIAPATGGVIVRTAAEGASAEDIERDLVFLQKLWKEIESRAKKVKGPALIYQEAELPLRVIRDLFTGDFERALVDDDRALKRITGYLKKTSPHMAERVSRYREKVPLFETYGVDAEIRSTLSRRVDLPSGGYLVFDYAEAFTVIDVNTGRFVGSRSKTSTARLEDTITKNNLEAVKEVVRQLRLRDVGGIIVIDFIDMANPKNRASVEEALQKELERDRTKTYVVEISPLGLVEMTRQNVTDGPREILTRKCPTCAGDGIVLSETSAAVDAERRLRALVASKPRSKAFRVQLNARVAAALIGPGAARLLEIEAATRRRFFIESIEDVPLDHFVVQEEGLLEKLQPDSPLKEGQELELKLVELGLRDSAAGVAKVDGIPVVVGDAAKLVGKKVTARIERVLDGVAYATLLSPAPEHDAGVITAEAMAEKPTRVSRAKKPDETAAVEEAGDEEDEELAPEAAALETEIEADADADANPEEEVELEAPADPEAAPAVEGDQPVPARKRTRRGSRGGRNRKRKPAGAAAAVAESNGEAESEPGEPEIAVARIHVPEPDLGHEDEPEATDVEPQVADADADAAANGAEAAATPPRKRTRRGSRGGRNRKRKPAAAVSAESAEPGAAPPD